jgi:hypothetical protein
MSTRFSLARVPFDDDAMAGGGIDPLAAARRLLAREGTDEGQGERDEFHAELRSRRMHYTRPHASLPAPARPTVAGGPAGSVFEIEEHQLPTDRLEAVNQPQQPVHGVALVEDRSSSSSSTSVGATLLRRILCDVAVLCSIR